jgi:selenocysteine lyase/cysteine desulfurase
VIFPFLADDRLSVRAVPLGRLLDEIDDAVDLVAVSAVQSSDGAMIDLDHLHHAAQLTETKTYVDVTQAAGWLPLAVSRFDVTACHAYKWLCAPRGAGFMTVGPGADDWLRPVVAGWYGGEDPWDSIYGPPLRLASDARRFDLSPPWFSFAAAVPALEILADIGPDAVGAHDVALANRFRSAVGLDPADGAIVAFETDAGPALRDAGIAAAMRAGKVRLSFHLYTTEDDVDRAAEVVVAHGGVRAV